MSFIKIPVKGMCDILPGELRLRQRILSSIKSAYIRYGFEEIETPVMEHIENLTSKQGGDNEKLIFKVMKRGAELARAKQKNEDLADMGMRYDLTVPLARYYANNSAKLLSPFKAMQIANVWRADNPQKGRFRQFMQCDIDILGDSTNYAEIELISATANMLMDIFKDIDIPSVCVHINDRRILIAAALEVGFKEDEISSVLISLDKLDKIGYDGVEKELLSKGYDPSIVETYLDIYKSCPKNITCQEFCDKIGSENIEESVVSNLSDIINCCKISASSKLSFIFDPTLVRGMGYYTGPIFEIFAEGYSFSIAGGGRYDEMIEKFSGIKTSAVGFSIGFERIVTILKDYSNEQLTITDDGVAFIVDKNVSTNKKMEVFETAQQLRKSGKIVTVQIMKKNLKFQIDELAKNGYSDIRRIYSND